MKLFKSRLPLAILTGLVLTASTAFATIQATIKPSATTDAVDVFFMSNVTSSQTYSGIQVVIAIPNTVTPAPSPLGATVNGTGGALGAQTGFTGTIPNIITNNTGMGALTMRVDNIGGQYVYLFNFTGISSAAAAFTANVEKLALTVHFDNVTSQPVPNMQSLVSLADGGLSGQHFFYIEQGGNDLTNSAAPFYNGSAAAATNGGCVDYGCKSSVVLTAAHVLPVKLTSFTALASGCAADISWNSASEINNSYYAVEASLDATSYTQVAKVTSKNSATGAYYSIAQALGSGTNYFRLKMVDYDGFLSYSNVVAVTGTGACSTGINVKVSPNPTTSVLNVKGLTSGSHISLIDNNGKKLTEVTATGTSQAISVSNYASGLYTLQVKAADGTTTNVKVVKQ